MAFTIRHKRPQAFHTQLAWFGLQCAKARQFDMLFDSTCLIQRFY